MGKKSNEDTSAVKEKKLSVRVERAFYRELNLYEINVSDVCRAALERAILDAKLGDPCIEKTTRISYPDGREEITVTRKGRREL